MRTRTTAETGDGAEQGEQASTTGRERGPAVAVARAGCARLEAGGAAHQGEICSLPDRSGDELAAGC